MASKKTAGKGRTISRAKRNNQRRNKLVKKGKLKPNSKSTWIQSQQEKRLKTKVRQARAEERDGEEEGDDRDEDELMDAEDAFLLSNISRGSLLEQGSGNMKRLETRAYKRMEGSRMNEKEQRGLLPIKTKKGLVMKTMDVEDEEEEEEDGEELEMQEEEKTKVNGVRLVNGADSTRTVLSLLSEREVALQDLRIQVGSMASAFVENPEERVHILERLIQMMDEQPVYLRNVGFKLISTSVNELLKDVIPNYKIAHHNQDDTLQKKDTLRLQKYENSVLQCAKNHLMKLEKLVKKKDLGDSGIGLHALKCLCDLLVTHPQFNYAPNIIKLVVPRLDDKSAAVREIVKTSMEQLFKNDRKGDISLLVVKSIKFYVKAKNYGCKPAVLECMLCLRLFYIDTVKPEDESDKKKKQHLPLTKREKKRQKQLQKVEKEMLEAKGEEAKVVRNRNFTEVSKILFEMLFRIIKSTEDQQKSISRNLLPAALKCISTFCHTINVDFFDDLLRVLSRLLKEAELSQTDQLLCVKTAFDILTGPGEFLTYDPGHFTRVLYDMIPTLDLNAPGSSAAVCSIVRNMIIKRKKLVSKNLVHAFSKALAFSALHMTPEESVEYLETLCAVKSCHLRTFEALLESEEHVPSKVSSFGLRDGLDVGTFSLWELQLLRTHYVKEVGESAKKILLVRDV